jgi:dTMP kinase
VDATAKIAYDTPMMDRPETGILIAVEGIDGAGKTTQVGLLAEFLRRAGESPVCSKEPTDGPWGQKIRESAASGRMDLADELHAFIEDRKQHVRELILPALGDDKTVILDRYLYSTVAYQGTRGGMLDSLMHRMLQIAPEPDVVILLDVPAEVGIKRVSQGRGESPNAFETIDNLAAVRKGFLDLARKYSRIELINGTQSIEAVHKQIVQRLIDRLVQSKCHSGSAWLSKSLSVEQQWAEMRRGTRCSR